MDPLENIFSSEYVMRWFGHLIDFNNPGSYVYFVNDGTSAIKIGTAINIPARVKSLQTGSSRKIVLLYVLPCKRHEYRTTAYNLESELHQLYESYHIHGEWYDLMDKLDHKSFEAIFAPKSTFLPDNKLADVPIATNPKKTYDGPVFLSVRKTKDLTGLSMKSIRAGCKSGIIPHIRIGEGENARFMINIPILLEQLWRAN